MAYAGQVISNPVSGERIAFLRTAADTGGELLELELTLSPDGHVPGAHVHPSQTETFHVLEGTLAFRLGLRRIVAGPGDVVSVPAGAVHRFVNAGGGVARARVEVRPALAMEDLLETAVALAEAGETNRKGMPKPVALSLFVRRFEREVRAPFPPHAVVKAVTAPLAWIGRRRERAAAPASEPAFAT